MTIQSQSEFAIDAVNPLDLVEQKVAGNEWAYERLGNDEITAAVPGSWCEYHLRFFWREDGSVLQVASMFDFRVPDNKRAPIYEVIALINERIWMGHFELWSEEGVVMFRHAVFAEDNLSGISSGHAELLIETVLTECERFYPVFQFVIWAGKNPSEAIEAAMLEPMGEA